MKKASEYRRHAEECHALSNGMTGQQRDQLLEMAATWERLAEDRAALVKRHPNWRLTAKRKRKLRPPRGNFARFTFVNARFSDDTYIAPVSGTILDGSGPQPPPCQTSSPAGSASLASPGRRDNIGAGTWAVCISFNHARHSGLSNFTSRVRRSTLHLRLWLACSRRCRLSECETYWASTFPSVR